MPNVSWKYRKVARGVELALQLLADIAEWRRLNSPAVSVALSSNGHTVDYVLTFVEKIPLEIWALKFGEVVHSFQSALDAHACSVAGRNGIRDLRGVYFPVARSQQDWKTKIQAWGRISATTSGRVEAIQPICLHGAEKVSDDLLSLIHDLDIRDKHRGMILARGEARVMADDVGGTAPSGAKLTFLANSVLKLTPAGGKVSLISSSVRLSSANLTSTRASFGHLSLSVKHKSSELALENLLKALIFEIPRVLRYLDRGHPAVSNELRQSYADCRSRPSNRGAERPLAKAVVFSSMGSWSIHYQLGT